MKNMSALSELRNAQLFGEIEDHFMKIAPIKLDKAVFIFYRLLSSPKKNQIFTPH